MLGYLIPVGLWVVAAVKLHLWWWTVAVPPLTGYLWSCVRYPMTGCPRKCGGKVRDESGNNWRNCWWCSGRSALSDRRGAWLGREPPRHDESEAER